MRAMPRLWLGTSTSLIKLRQGLMDQGQGRVGDPGPWAGAWVEAPGEADQGQ